MKKSTKFTLFLLSIFLICIGGRTIPAYASELQNKEVEQKEFTLRPADDYLRFGVQNGIAKHWYDFQLYSMIDTGGVTETVDIHFRPISGGEVIHPSRIPDSFVTTSDFKIIYRRSDKTIYSEKQFSKGTRVKEIATHLWGTTMRRGDSIQVTYTNGENQFAIWGNVDSNFDGINFYRMSKANTYEYGMGVEVNGLKAVKVFSDIKIDDGIYKIKSTMPGNSLVRIGFNAAIGSNVYVDQESNMNLRAQRWKFEYSAKYDAYKISTNDSNLHEPLLTWASSNGDNVLLWNDSGKNNLNTKTNSDQLWRIRTAGDGRYQLKSVYDENRVLSFTSNASTKNVLAYPNMHFADQYFTFEKI